MNQFCRARVVCHIFDLVSLLGQRKKKSCLIFVAACQLGLFTPVVSQIPKQYGIACNYTSVLSGAFLLPTLLAATLLHFLECQLLR